MKTIICAVLLYLAGAATLAGARTPGEVDIGGMLREAPLQGLTVPSRLLSDYRGLPLIINVWASWCGPCRMEMGSLERLSRRYGGKRFRVIGISTDDYVDPAKGYVRDTQVSFDNFIDSKLAMENMLGADRIPLTLLVDAKGRVLGKYYGAKEWDSPEALDLIGKSFGIKLSK